MPHDLHVFADRQYRDRKRAAIDAYSSQTMPLIADDVDGIVISKELVDHFAQCPRYSSVAEDGAARAQTFDALFAENPDPWNFETSAYECNKRAATIAALEGSHFHAALEIGCANGVLARALAPRCDTLLALDVSLRALEIARARSASNDTIRYRRAEVPRDWPGGSFDLIVLSEVLYFLSQEEIVTVSQRAFEALEGNGLCLLVNWTGPNDLPVGGQQAVRLFGGAAQWHSEPPRIEPSYRIDQLRK